MSFKRNLFDRLVSWEKDPYRKPLILRGARQVGKTTLVKEFGGNFAQKIFLNLEKKEDKDFFEQNDNTKTIIESLFLRKNLRLDFKNTLLFIDEIQESPKAIQLLRYFYEDFPDLRVIAAGSLLEFALKKVPSFPVGRVEYLYLHPLNFQEYLLATNNDLALEQLNVVPVPSFAHTTLMERFHEYAIVGGMPEILKVYTETKSLTYLPKIYESIIRTYQDDIEKYSSNETERRVIKHIMSVAHGFLEQRIKFQNFGNSNYKSREVGEAFNSLHQAKILRLVFPTTSIEPPLLTDFKKSPRMQFLDTGLLNYMIGIQADMLLYDDLSLLYRGAIIPHLLSQELISLGVTSDELPSFWVREKTQSSAEVDLIIKYKNLLMPVEIKSGSSGSLKSLHQFIDASPHHYAVRMYGGEFKVENATTPAGKQYLLMNLPYYLGTKIHEYIGYFVEGKFQN